MKNKYILILFVAIFSCGCERFLDERTSKTSSVPNSLVDLQALLDAGNKINFGNYPSLLEASTDNFYLDETGYAQLIEFEKDIYAFKNPEFYGNSLGYWSGTYEAIGITNVVLDALPQIISTGGLEEKNIRGQALFHRGFAHFLLAQLYCKPFDRNGSNQELGIPLRLTSDFNIASHRGTVEKTYHSILTDLEMSAELLDVDLGSKTRPNKLTAYAALSRVYLAMEDYDKAEQYANLALQLSDDLIDFNTISIDAAAPFAPLNEETILFSYCSGLIMLNPRYAIVPDELFDMFAEHDLRKKAYFQLEATGKYSFKGTYMGFTFGSFFVGMTTSELFLNRAESRTRLGDVEGALVDINRLLSNRYNRDFFVPVNVKDKETLLLLILNERRKELIMRGTRWSDLRRLNKDDRFKKTLTRTLILQGIRVECELEPDIRNYVYKIPREIISMSGIEQN